MKIRNMEALLAHGDLESRGVLVPLLEETLRRLDAGGIIREIVRVEGDRLRVGGREWDLRERRRIVVIGAGKAANSMARAVEERLGARIAAGLVVAKLLEPGDDLERIELVTGGHPLPNREGQETARRILRLVEGAGPRDLFISLVSGGSSALIACPVEGIDLEDEIRVTEELFRRGARILEINAIRRHISATNGGRLAQKVEERGAEMINLVISDLADDGSIAEPGKPGEYYGTPIAPDRTTLQDARRVLDRYELWERIPPAIAAFLKGSGAGRETPKRFGERVHHFVLQKPADACRAAAEAAGAVGLKAHILTTVLEGESREAGIFLASVAREVVLNGRPFPPPCLLIAGGETTTRVEGVTGEGGPSQELALGFALEVRKHPGPCLMAVDTDGTDGPTLIAGGLADGRTAARAAEMGLDVHAALQRHESSRLLRALGDEIVTGNTGTNLCDLNLLYIPGRG